MQLFTNWTKLEGKRKRNRPWFCCDCATLLSAPSLWPMDNWDNDVMIDLRNVDVRPEELGAFPETVQWGDDSAGKQVLQNLQWNWKWFGQSVITTTTKILQPIDNIALPGLSCRFRCWELWGHSRDLAAPRLWKKQRNVFSTCADYFIWNFSQ